VVLAQSAGSLELAVDLQENGPVNLQDTNRHTAMSPTERTIAALKDTHLFWGPALKLDDDDGARAPQAWRDNDHNLQAMASDALDFCDEVKDQETRGEEAVEGQGQGRRRRCVHRVVSAHDTRFTHTPAGINDWTQPMQAKGIDGEAYGPEHNTAITLQKVIDQFKPHTSWHGQKIFDNGVMVRIPTYDRSKYRGFRGASKEANLLFATSAGNRHLGDYTMDSDIDTSGDESYDQLALDAEKTMWGAKPGFAEAHMPNTPPAAKLASSMRSSMRSAPIRPRTQLVKHTDGKFTIWEHARVPKSAAKHAKKDSVVDDPLMKQAVRFEAAAAGVGVRMAITRLYGPVAPQVTAEQVPSAEEKQTRLQRLWEVMPTINIGATPPIPVASVVTQTQSIVTPGIQYVTPPVGTNGFAMVQPYPMVQTYPINGGMPAYSNMMGATGFNMPAANMPAAPAPMSAAPAQCGAPNFAPCAQGVVVTGSSAIAAAPFPGYTQWMQPLPIQYAQVQLCFPYLCTGRPFTKCTILKSQPATKCDVCMEMCLCYVSIPVGYTKLMQLPPSQYAQVNPLRSFHSAL